MLCSSERWRLCYFLTLESPCLRGRTRSIDVLFLRSSNSLVSGRSFFWAWCVFMVGIWAEQTPVWPCLPFCLTGVTPPASPHTRRPAFNVCVCVNVCSDVFVYIGCVTPCFKSIVQAISSLPGSHPYQKTSIIHPTTLFIISRHFFLLLPVTIIKQKSRLCSST